MASISLKSVRRKIISCYAEAAAENELYRTALQYVGIPHAERVDLLRAKFERAINGLDVRAIIGAIQYFDRAKFPKWLVDGDFFIEMDDNDYFFNKQRKNYGY